MEKMQSLLSDPESMQQLQELAQMLQADSGQESTETESARLLQNRRMQLLPVAVWIWEH